MARHAFIPTLLVALILQFLTMPAQAAKPGETLLPATTKGFLSIPDLDDFRAAFERTQLGGLVQDPVMKPFVEDLQRQLKSKLNKRVSDWASVGTTWRTPMAVKSVLVSFNLVTLANHTQLP